MLNFKNKMLATLVILNLTISANLCCTEIVVQLKMFLVALTGGIASGKSTVTRMFIDSGLPVIDADTIARKVVEPGRKAWKKLKQEFGNDIFFKDGSLNREKLGEIIFQSTDKRKKVNLITHPEIVKEMILSAIKLGIKGHPFIVMDIPLLYETGDLVRLMHKVIVVSCSEKLQVERLLARSKLTEEGARLRIASQMPLDQKCHRADYVIDNSYTIEETKLQVDKIIQDLRQSKFHYKIRLYFASGIGILFFGLFYLFGNQRQ